MVIALWMPGKILVIIMSAVNLIKSKSHCHPAPTMFANAYHIPKCYNSTSLHPLALELRWQEIQLMLLLFLVRRLYFKNKPSYLYKRAIMCVNIT